MDLRWFCWSVARVSTVITMQDVQQTRRSARTKKRTPRKGVLDRRVEQRDGRRVSVGNLIFFALPPPLSSFPLSPASRTSSSHFREINSLSFLPSLSLISAMPVPIVSDITGNGAGFDPASIPLQEGKVFVVVRWLLLLEVAGRR